MTGASTVDVAALSSVADHRPRIARLGLCMPRQLPALTLVAVEAVRLLHSFGASLAPTEAGVCRKAVEEATVVWKDLSCPAVLSAQCPECPACPAAAEKTLEEICLPRCAWVAVSLYALAAAVGRCCQRRYAPPPRRGRGVVAHA